MSTFLTFEDKIRQLYIETITNCAEEKLDKVYMTCSAGSFTRRQLANEVANKTEFGDNQLKTILSLTIDMLERGKLKQQ